MEELFITLFIAFLVFLVFGVDCHELAMKNDIGHTGCWFIVGFCLGPFRTGPGFSGD